MRDTLGSLLERDDITDRRSNIELCTQLRLINTEIDGYATHIQYDRRQKCILIN